MQLVLYGTLPLAGVILGWTIRWLYAKFQLSSTEQLAERLQRDAEKDAEARQKELILETRDALQRERNEQEREFRERQRELQRQERRLLQKEENLEEKAAAIGEEQQGLATRERNIEDRNKQLDELEIHWRNEMERISGLTQEEARKLIMSSLEDETRHDAQGLVHKIEQEATVTAEKNAREILISTVQRLASEVNAEVTVSSVSLPND